MEIRTGLGYDIHRLTEGSGLLLGGVRIDAPVALEGHSDGDVLLHALTDALLGAVGGGDIGELFPDTDEANRDRDSRDFLRAAMEIVEGKGFAVGNIDTVVVAEEPKLGPHKAAIRDALAKLCRIPEERVNVKAKTHEGLGPLGRKEGLAAWATVLVHRERLGLSAGAGGPC